MSITCNNKRFTKFIEGVAMKPHPYGQGLCVWECSFTYLQDLGVGQIAHQLVGKYSEIHLGCRPCEGGLYNRNPTMLK